MLIREILKKSDGLFMARKPREATVYLEEQIALAKEQGEWQAELTISNELMGYYRSISEFKKAQEYAQRAVSIAEEYDVESTAEGVTTYLNVANVYRAMGKKEKALFLYHQVEEIYTEQGAGNDYKGGVLYNNMSVVSLELGKSEDAMKYGEKALEILKDIPRAKNECATTYGNLAGILLVGKEGPELEKADIYIDEALKILDESSENPYACSILAMKAYTAYLKKDLQKSLEFYERAMDKTMDYYGKNADYVRLEKNYKCIQALLNGEDKE